MSAPTARGDPRPPRRSFARAGSPAPAHVRELGAGAGLPAGLSRGRRRVPGSSRAATPTSGCSSATPPEPVSAARFTASGTPAAPVLVSRERCRLDALRAVLANSGCANAATGRRGLDDAAKTQGAAALRPRASTRREVALASTGGDQPPPARRRRCSKGILRGARAAARRRRRRLPAGDPDDRRVREARQPRGASCRRAPSG